MIVCTDIRIKQKKTYQMIDSLQTQNLTILNDNSIDVIIAIISYDWSQHNYQI